MPLRYGSWSTDVSVSLPTFPLEKLRVYLAILQAQVGYASHRRMLSFSQILVDLVDAFGDVRECLIESVTPAE